MTNANRPSEECLNAFVDGECDRAERERVFGAGSADPSVDRDIGELRKMKALMHHAYEKVPPAPAPARRNRGNPRRRAAIAALALGLGAGLAVFEWHGAPRSPPEAGPAASFPAQAGMPGVVIQVADGDEAKWRLALEQASIAAAGVDGRRIAVVVLAYGPGLDMLRGESAVRPELDAALAHGIRLVACGNTMHRDNVAPRQLLPGVTVAGSGATLEILALQRAGYAYIRI